MKNLSLVAILLVFNLPVFAQAPSFEFGLKGGLNLSRLALENNDVPQGVKPGANVGVTATYNVSQHLFLQSGLAFSMKGTKVEGAAPLGFSERILYPGKEAILTSNQLYLQVPVYVGYKIGMTSSTKLVLTGGPYFAHGIGGKTQLTGDIIYGDMIEYSTLKEPTFGSRGLQSFDYGIGSGIGVEIGRTIVGVSYELGLKNIAPTGLVYFPFYNGSYKNRNASLSLEYKF
jgi:hypothetical protein